ncbi:MAG: LOG family protein [Pseudomonadota bacterium]
MKRRSRLRTSFSLFRSIYKDLDWLNNEVPTAQTLSPAHRLAFEDPDFLRADAQRGARLMLEYEKVEQSLIELEVHSTVILFGGARIPAPGETANASTKKIRRSLEGLSSQYEAARELARAVSAWSVAESAGKEMVIATGGGPGVMEAGSRGATEAGGRSIGFGVILPNEAPSSFVTPDLAFNFHYFAIRKMHFLMRAKAIAIFPGGFGTLDELFEVLTLIQTQRMDPVPIVLFAEAFWRKIIDFEALKDAGTISAEDLKLFTFVETADDAWGLIRQHYGLS